MRRVGDQVRGGEMSDEDKTKGTWVAVITGLQHYIIQTCNKLR